MNIADNNDLDDIVRKIEPSKTFDTITPEYRVIVLDLYVKLRTGDLLESLTDTLDVIDTRMSHISEWFEKSKLWEGRLT